MYSKPIECYIEAEYGMLKEALLMGFLSLGNEPYAIICDKHTGRLLNIPIESIILDVEN